MPHVAFDLPSDLADIIAPPADDLERVVRLAAAAKLFEAGRLSSGAAAQLAGLPRVAFLAELDGLGVAVIDHAPDDLAADAFLG
jgi:predicted HTH domain antitoxin